MTHKTLVALGVKWLSRKCSVVLAEFSTANWETPDVIGWSGGFSTLIECKASRSDFKADAKKPFRAKGRALGFRRFYLCPAGMIKPDEIPEKWGLLYAHKNRIIVECEAKGFPERCLSGELAYTTSMLRRAQIRIGSRPLSEWLRQENMYEAVRGKPPNAEEIKKQEQANLQWLLSQKP